MRLVAFTIEGTNISGTPVPSYNLTFPSQLNFINGLHLSDIITFALSLALTVAILLSLFFILFGGIKWIMSQGDKKELETAQKTIMYAIIGLVVVFLSFFILNIIGFAFRVPLLGSGSK